MLMRLPVLPPPYSSSLFPELKPHQIGMLKGKWRSGERPCFWCGRVISRLQRTLTVDHLIPASKGGTFSINNVVPCCRQCNTMKADSDLPEWLERVEQIVARLRGLVMMSG